MASSNKPGYMGENDPYHGMEGAIIRPKDIPRSEDSARNNLFAAEQSASKSPSRATRSQNSWAKSNARGLRNLEQSQTSIITNNVRGISSRNELSGKKKKKGFKKYLPLTAIAGTVITIASLFYGASTLLGSAFNSLVTRATDVQFTSYARRNTRIFKHMIETSNPTETTNGVSTKYTKFSNKFQKRLAKAGIEVGHLDSNGVYHSGQGGSTTVLKFDGEYIDAASFQSKFEGDINFREAYYKAKRGRASGFFDSPADKFYTDRAASRDVLHDYQITGDKKTDTDNFEEIISSHVTNADGSIKSAHTEYDEETKQEHLFKDGDDISTKYSSGIDPEVKARSLVNSIAGKASTGVVFCSILRVANIAAITYSAYQLYQSVPFFLGIAESNDKKKAGYGNNSYSSEEYLTRAEESTITYIDESGETVTETTYGSPVEAEGMKVMLGNTPANTSITEHYSTKNIVGSAAMLAATVGGGAATNKYCAGITAASAVISLSAGAVPGGAIATFAIGFLSQAVLNVAISGAVAMLVTALLPQFTQLFSENIFESDRGKGKAGGELAAIGAVTANGAIAQDASGFVPASEEYLKEQNNNTVVALAMEAELDRKGRSPFDITSENTFLGSLLTKFAYVSYSSTLAGAFNEVATVTGDSIRNLSGIASAADQPNNLYTSQYSECEDLPGAMCDIYGLPIMVSDSSTLDLSPDDPTYVSVISKNLDKNEKIKDGSELAKYINFCSNRQSPWGVTDANILNSLQSNNGVIVNNIPYLNDVTDFVNMVEDVDNSRWATGELCVASSSNPRWDSEFKYYQRYIEDMRILSDMGDDDVENPVLAYEQYYEEEHPVDRSFNGTLARISGMTTDDIAFLQEYSRYSTWLANYDPSERYAFGAPEKELEPRAEEKTQLPAVMAVVKNTTNIFVDRRNYVL